MNPIHPLSLPGPRPEDLLATGYVSRWHNKPTSRTQTLADHLAKVTLLADYLGRTQQREPYTMELGYLIMRWALCHDLPETEHGDIPAPAKRWLNGNLAHAAGYDGAVAQDWWEDRNSVVPDPGGLASDLVRLADILEAACWYWVFGLDRDLATTLIFDTFKVARMLMPDLMGPMGDILAAAGVPALLIGEAAA